ncbi:serine protease [Kordiimonas sediminis]|uniref:Probable periplasmic serine endoprotease DegP-like n=1 Tax=Kordiimonas sediminis TaxID=1735581 RepID=A0A919AZB1_9PROT|nr:Do family serine endopeptidase [Kordiimonas sediminis]GHF30712.1 serine protease [Kordiimonas sediminis]
MNSLHTKAFRERLAALSFVRAAMVVTVAVSALIASHNPVAARGAPDSFADLVEKLSPAVVNISTVTTVTPSNNRSPRLPEGMPFGDWFDEFRDRQEEAEPRQARSLGSGFIIDAEGYVVTNNHVVAEADEITVTLFDEREFEAELIGRDSRTDLALLKIKSDKKFPYVSFGDSDKSRVGDWVLTIGNPFGLGGSVSAGILSGRNRNADGGAYIDYLQTDAPINRGNSGGPMFNMDGDVIGVNTLIFSPSGGNVGIGFAIPSHDAQLYISELREFGRVRRGLLGVTIQAVTEEVAESQGLENVEGAIVTTVAEGGPAEDAGIRIGDIIISWDGKPVDSSRSLSRVVALTKIGKPVDVVLIRDGERMTIPVTTGEMSEELNRDEAIREGRERRSQTGERDMVEGMELMSMNSDVRRRFNIADDVEGVVVVRVSRSSAAGRAGIRSGTVIMRVNSTQVTDASDVVSALDEAREAGRENALLLVHYRGNTVHLPLRIQEESEE